MPAVKARGRPATEFTSDQLKTLAELLAIAPGLGLPNVRAALPEAPVAALREALRAHKQELRSGRRSSLAGCRWDRAGAVWALDGTETEAPIDGCYPKALVVRDLASRRILAMAPVLGERAEATRSLLLELFIRHSPPLILKSDNGSAFTGSELGRLLEQWSVIPLLSPPATPRYNGSVEASIKTLNRRVERAAAGSGRPGLLRSEDLIQAMEISNELLRPWGHQGPTPDEVWRAREPITPAERQAFGKSLSDSRRALRNEAVRLNSGEATPARLERQAITRALEECGILEMRRGRIAPVIPR